MRILRDLSLGKYFTFQPAKSLPVYNWFYYKEGFSPQLLDRFYRIYGFKSVYDPFMGSGTTLVFSRLKDLVGYGVDISPLSVLVSKVKASCYGKEVEAALEHAKKALKHLPEWDWKFELFPPSRAFPKRNYSNILSVRAYLENLEGELKDFLMVALLSVLPQTSAIVKDGGVLRINWRKKIALFRDVFLRKVKRMVKEAVRDCKGEVFVKEGDARFEEAPDADAVFTSPPYLNNVDYTKVYGMELSLLGVDTKKLRKKMFRSFLSNNFKEDVREAFFKDMEQFLERVSSIARVFIVISDSIIFKEYVPTLKITAEIGESLGYEATIIEGLMRKARINLNTYTVPEGLIILEKKRKN